MSSRIKSAVQDLSTDFKPVGIGSADMRRLWIGCGHKHHSGKKRGKVLWLCAKCAGGKA